MENTIKMFVRLHEQPSQMNTKSVFGNFDGKDSLCPKSNSRNLIVSRSVNSVRDRY